MIKQSLAVLALSGALLSAQDRTVTLLYTQSKPSDLTVGANHLETETYSGLGLRYAQSVGKAFGARLAFEGTWKLRTSGSDLKENGVNVNTATTTYAVRQESLGMGLSATWTQVVEYGVSLDIRKDNTSLMVETNVARVDLDQAVVRPWIGLRVGYTFPVVAAKPFVGLEFGLPLSKRRGSDDLAGIFDVGRVLRPKSELSLALGLRF